jgi:hypothetical protein
MDCSAIQFRYANQFSTADLDQLVRLFQAAAFWAKDRTRDDMETAIAHSYPVVTAWDGAKADWLCPSHLRRRLSRHHLGCGDLARLPGRRAGPQLVETLVAHPHMSRVERVYLMTTHQQGFYKRIGFAENASTTMVLYNSAEIEMLPSLGAPAEAPAEIRVG